MKKTELMKLIEELAIMGNNGYLFLNYGDTQLGPADDEVELYEMLTAKHPNILEKE